MSETPSAVVFHELDHWDPEPLREQLIKGGFHHEVLGKLGLPERWLRSESRRSALLGHVSEDSPVHTLIRLFTLGDAVDGDLALRALGRAAHGLLELGFLEAGNGRVRSLYQICPVNDGWLACDFIKTRGGAADFVMGVGGSSMLLASLAPPVRGSALELGCGAGWLSGKLARSGMRVVGTDLNPRALELARFSARLCGHTAVDFRQGDAFSSVGGTQFDLIVANPPYVQSPGGNQLYREGSAGQSVCEHWLRSIPDHLMPDGIAVILLNWTHGDDEDWADAPLSWAPAEGVRRWLFQTECSSPADYAWKWISGDPRFREEEASLAEMRRWLDFYQKQGARRISGGFMILQRCVGGDGWMRAESRSIESIGAGAGEEILRVLNNHTWLESKPDLLASRFTVPEGIRAEADMSLGANGWERRTIRLTSPARLAYDGQIDENILRLLALVREGQTPAAMVREIQAKPEFADIVDLPDRIAALARELVFHGMLAPAP